uniref:Uncharacterized protein n=1 Tax=Nothobranchius furzeri TaxID=105023 RepID=A0A8C6K9S3_NOTFU
CVAQLFQKRPPFPPAVARRPEQVRSARGRAGRSARGRAGDQREGEPADQREGEPPVLRCCEPVPHCCTAIQAAASISMECVTTYFFIDPIV